MIFCHYCKVAQRGEVKQVKVLGAIALIDEGETDWKILTIDITDPLADKIDGKFDIFYKEKQSFSSIFKAKSHLSLKALGHPTDKKALYQFSF